MEKKGFFVGFLNKVKNFFTNMWEKFLKKIEEFKKSENKVSSFFKGLLYFFIPVVSALTICTFFPTFAIVVAFIPVIKTINYLFPNWPAVPKAAAIFIGFIAFELFIAISPLIIICLVTTACFLDWNKWFTCIRESYQEICNKAHAIAEQPVAETI